LQCKVVASLIYVDLRMSTRKRESRWCQFS